MIRNYRGFCLAYTVHWNTQNNAADVKHADLFMNLFRTAYWRSSYGRERWIKIKSYTSRTGQKLYSLDRFPGDDTKHRLNIHPHRTISCNKFFVRLTEFFAIPTPAVSFESICKVDKQVGAFVLRSPWGFTVFPRVCK